jgi:hypothetical protein
MVYQSKREYLEKIRNRYARAGRKYKQKILDEFCTICGYHRKHAIRLLRQQPTSSHHRPGPASLYTDDIKAILKYFWLITNRLCSKLLKAALPLWLPYYPEQRALTPKIREQLSQISPATIDRLLRPVRKQYGSHGLAATRPVHTLKLQVPIRTSHRNVDCLGFIQADTVAHGGNSVEGNFIWSLTLTDVFSQWTETRAVWNKGYSAIAQAIADIEAQLPFPILGFHVDNGGEFLNHHLWRYFHNRQPPVQFTRTRPDHKDENAYVEQKNWTHVRQLLGYQRIDNPDLLQTINRLYEAWNLWRNLFCPTLKLLSKEKVGSRYIRRYAAPRTPAQRLIDSSALNEAVKTHLTEKLTNVNPINLKKFIDHHQQLVLSVLR